MKRGPYRKQDVESRFWSKVNRKGPDDCWEWQGSPGKDGYGRFGVNGRTLKPNRFAWELVHGEITEGLHVCHRCDNPLCCNPIHLFLGTNADNRADMVSKGRQARGEKNGNAKLTEAKIHEIRVRLSYGGVTQKSLLTEYDVSRATMSRIANKRRWAHV